MSTRSFILGSLFGAMVAATIGLTSAVIADVSPKRLEAARALIGETVKISEFETMLRQVIQGFSAEITAQANGRSEREVVRVMMEQARIAISENRGEYLEGIARIYANHLTASDLEEATVFFSSRAGKRWSDAQDGVLTDTIVYASEAGSALRERVVSNTVERLQIEGVGRE
jgi:hypothetical protein